VSDSVAIALVTAVCTATPIVVGQILTFLATRKATYRAADKVAVRVEEVAVAAKDTKEEIGQIKVLVNGHNAAYVKEIKHLRRALAARPPRRSLRKQVRK
jgi:type IV secretory pathway protease TraF